MTVIQRICPHTHLIDDREESDRLQTVFQVIVGYVRKEGDDMSMRQIASLLTIQRKPMTIGELARTLNLSNPTISRTVDALEKLKYVQRVRGCCDDQDNRKVTVRITPKGLAKIGRLISAAKTLHVINPACPAVEAA